MNQPSSDIVESIEIETPRDSITRKELVDLNENLKNSSGLRVKIEPSGQPALIIASNRRPITLSLFTAMDEIPCALNFDPNNSSENLFNFTKQELTDLVYTICKMLSAPHFFVGGNKGKRVIKLPANDTNVSANNHSPFVKVSRTDLLLRLSNIQDTYPHHPSIELIEEVCATEVKRYNFEYNPSNWQYVSMQYGEFRIDGQKSNASIQMVELMNSSRKFLPSLVYAQCEENFNKKSLIHIPPITIIKAIIYGIATRKEPLYVLEA